MQDEPPNDDINESDSNDSAANDALAKLPPAVPFPIDALPRALRDYVSERAESMCCPPDFIAVTLLTCAGAAIGTSVQLQIKSDWYEWPLLFTAIVGPSGSKKTPAKSVAIRFTTDKAIEYHALHQEALKKYQIDMARYNAADTDSDSTIEKPKRPTLPRTWLCDSTMEAIAKRLQENPRGLVLLRDELPSLVLSINQYRGGRGADLQNFLSLWSCDRLTIDRKGEPDPIVLNQPFLAVTGGIQPGLLPKVFGGDRLYDGFTPRFLFTHPEVLPHRSSDSELRDATLYAAKGVFDTLFLLSPSDAYAIVPIPQTVRLSKEAYDLFRDWADAIGAQTDELAEDDPFRATLTKMAGQLGRIALILHCARWASHEFEGFNELTTDTMKSAIVLADYFVAHARRVWAQLTESREDSQIRRVLAWMRKQKRPVTRREVQRSGVAGFKNALQVDVLMQHLVDCGLVEVNEIGRTKRYSIRRAD